MKKQEVYNKLMRVGRDLVISNGADFLTARKLSDASGCSVGTIYNQFSNMDNFIIAQNLLTLDELKLNLQKRKFGSDYYKNINAHVNAFVDFVFDNSNLWFLLYNFHLHADQKALPSAYLKKLLEINKIWQKSFNDIFIKLGSSERKVASEVLWVSIFAVSGLLTTKSLNVFSRVNKKIICQLLLNTYMAGLRALKK
jgi:AcrR family transcriptional regulator